MAGAPADAVGAPPAPGATMTPEEEEDAVEALRELLELLESLTPPQLQMKAVVLGLHQAVRHCIACPCGDMVGAIAAGYTWDGRKFKVLTMDVLTSFANELKETFFLPPGGSEGGGESEGEGEGDGGVRDHGDGGNAAAPEARGEAFNDAAAAGPEGLDPAGLEQLEGYVGAMKTMVETLRLEEQSTTAAMSEEIARVREQLAEFSSMAAAEVGGLVDEAGGDEDAAPAAAAHRRPLERGLDGASSGPEATTGVDEAQAQEQPPRSILRKARAAGANVLPQPQPHATFVGGDRDRGAAKPHVRRGLDAVREAGFTSPAEAFAAQDVVQGDRRGASFLQGRAPGAATRPAPPPRDPAAAKAQEIDRLMLALAEGAGTMSPHLKVISRDLKSSRAQQPGTNALLGGLGGGGGGGNAKPSRPPPLPVQNEFDPAQQASTLRRRASNPSPYNDPRLPPGLGGRVAAGGAAAAGGGWMDKIRANFKQYLVIFVVVCVLNFRNFSRMSDMLTSDYTAPAARTTPVMAAQP